MKKANLFLIIFFSAFIINAQSLKWKPTIGINANSQKITGMQNSSKTKPGIDVGLLLQTKFKQNISLEFGLLYSGYSGTVERPLVFIDNPFPGAIPPQLFEKNKIQFLKIPVIVTLKQDKKEPFSGGLGLVLKKNIGFKREANFVLTPNDINADSYTLKTQSGSQIGIGLQAAIKKEFAISKNNFEVGLFYDANISKWQYPINKIDAKNTPYTLKGSYFSVLFSIVL